MCFAIWLAKTGAPRVTVDVYMRCVKVLTLS